MSVPLQSVPDNADNEPAPFGDESVSDARHEAAEIIALARKQAEAIVAEARSSDTPVASPLAALGENAEEIIGQVRKLIKKQRELQTERQEMVTEIAALKAERDELVHRLTDAVERMEELAALADQNQAMPPQSPPPAPRPQPTPTRPPTEEPPSRPQPPPSSTRSESPQRPAEKDTSLAARLKKAEAAERVDSEDTSLAARLKKAELAEAAEQGGDAKSARMEQTEKNIEAAIAAERATVSPAEVDDDDADGRSFYDRHSANLPRLEGDGGRSVLSAMGGMRPDLEVKGRKSRRSRKK